MQHISVGTCVCDEPLGLRWIRALGAVFSIVSVQSSTIHRRANNQQVMCATNIQAARGHIQSETRE